MATNDDDIGVLNGLIEVTIDSAEGYKEAAGDVKNPELKAIFQRRAVERRTATAALQSQVRALGGQPEDDGTVLASMHRKFLNLRNSVQSGDRVVIDEVERGEDHIKAKYEDAFKDGKLSASSLTVAQQAYGSVRSGHDEMSRLKHSLQH
ncbi:PA2169 family four-helix-bundle protein [Dyella jejuensis]|uniref:PA2169 family four-helix-bundle protein n=1 Tax=Dyella jejuensis TaxID=1432009 RepID=A0ABW8JHU1_9GAMM